MNTKELTPALNQGIRINQWQICIIANGDDKKFFIGTGFVFSRRDWIITAGHVVIEENQIKQNLFAIFPAKTDFARELNLIAYSKELDVAILEISIPLDKSVTPLFPASHTATPAKAFYCFAYDSNSFNIQASLGILKDTHKRDRVNSSEIILEIENNTIKGGASGGPILNLSGSVIGMMIQIFKDQDTDKAGVRVTSMNNIMKGLSIELNSADWHITKGT